jgi:hypothetical protein
MFEGNYLKAEDCKDGDIVKIIAEGEPSEIEGKKGKVKIVLNYDVEVNGQEKTFTPNMTNGRAMIEAWGEDDEKWVGKSFKVKIEKVLAFGKKVNSIVAEPIVEKAAEKQVVPVEKVK